MLRVERVKAQTEGYHWADGTKGRVFLYRARPIEILTRNNLIFLIIRGLSPSLKAAYILYLNCMLRTADWSGLRLLHSNTNRSTAS